MTPIEEFLQSLVTLDVWEVVKVLILFGLGLYLVFALVVIRQVQLMSKSLNGSLDLPLRLMALVHLGMVIGVFLFALVVL